MIQEQMLFGINNSSAIVFIKDKVVFKYNNIYQEISYGDLVKDYDLNNINKQTVVNYLTGNGMIQIYLMFFITSAILSFIYYSLSILLDIIILSVLGFLASRILKINIKFKAIYNMAVYSITLPVILYMVYLAINITTGFKVGYFRLAYDAISYIYIITAILMIKSDLIKQQIELMKIVEVQKQVKEDMDRKKEEERKKQEEKEKEKETDKSNDNKEKKKKVPKPKVAPEGGQAIEEGNE